MKLKNDTNLPLWINQSQNVACSRKGVNVWVEILKEIASPIPAKSQAIDNFPLSHLKWKNHRIRLAGETSSPSLPHRHRSLYVSHFTVVLTTAQAISDT
ncbi:hypothetical protein L1887_15278 [Cichorium endivia]|nr:hypothetical protein L1887_15278 [Cichorium endivia]